MARFNQTDFGGFPTGEKERARRHLERHARALLNQEEADELLELLNEGRQDDEEDDSPPDALTQVREALGGRSAREELRRLYAEAVYEMIKRLPEDMAEAEALLKETSGWLPQAVELGIAISRAKR